MKVLVVGSSGQLGSELQYLAPSHTNIDFIFTAYPEADITSKSVLTKLFEANAYEFCINCAAYTAVDKAETDEEAATLINATGPLYLAELCKKHDVKLIHISTDFVFDGTKTTPYTEEDEPNPISVYGLTKLKGEQAIQTTWEKHFIFRTSWLYSSFENNFVKTMLSFGKERGELSVVDDQWGTPTYARDLAEVIVNVITRQSKAYGLYHFSNAGATTWYGFAKQIFETAQMEVKLHAIPTSGYPTPAERPKYSVMDKTKVVKTFGVELKGWEKCLGECLT